MLLFQFTKDNDFVKAFQLMQKVIDPWALFEMKIEIFVNQSAFQVQHQGLAASGFTLLWPQKTVFVNFYAFLKIF